MKDPIDQRGVNTGKRFVPPDDGAVLPKISVITVCLNAEKTIEATLQSLGRQTYRHFEHIVIDGASRDGTLALLDRYRESISLVISEPDHGIYDAMNKGIKCAGGEIIYFLNADDTLFDSSTLENAAAMFNRFPMADVIYGDACLIYPDGRTAIATYPPKLSWDHFKDRTLCHQSVFTKRSAFDRVGLFDTSYQLAGDFAWIIDSIWNYDLNYQYTNLVLSCFSMGGSHGALQESGLLERERKTAIDQHIRNRINFIGSYQQSRVTVFALTIDDPVFLSCLDALHKQDCKGFVVDVIRNFRPVSAADQEMMRRCSTEYFIKLDEDMILNPDAVRRMTACMDAVPADVGMICFHLYDTDRETKIQGIKIFRSGCLGGMHMKDVRASDMELLEQMNERGIQWVLHGDIVGLHGTCYTPNSIYLRYKSMYEKDISVWNLLTWDIRKKADRYRETGDVNQLFALLGAVHGIIVGPHAADVEAKNTELYNMKELDLFRKLFLEEPPFIMEYSSSRSPKEFKNQPLTTEQVQWRKVPPPASGSMCSTAANTVLPEKSFVDRHLFARDTQAPYLIIDNARRNSLNADTVKHPRIVSAEYSSKGETNNRLNTPQDQGNQVHKRIMIACTHFWPSVGGVETISRELGGHLVDRGYHVDVATWARNDRIDSVHRGINIIELQIEQSEQGITPWVMQLRKLATSGDYSACILLADPRNFIIWSLEDAAMPQGTRLLIQPLINNEGYRAWNCDPEFRSRLSVILKNADAVIAISRDGAEMRYLREAGVTPFYIPNATERLTGVAGFRLRYGIPEGLPFYLHVANLWPVKNHDGLIRTLQEMPGDWRLVMIGHPSEDIDYVESVRLAISSDPRMLLIPGLPSEEIAAAMEEADILLLASHGEVSPVTIIEAMSHSLPWLATPSCGAVHDFGGGVITTLENFPETLELLLHQVELTKSLGLAGLLHWQECFSWSNVTNAWEMLIETGATNSSFEMPSEVVRTMKSASEKLAILFSKRIHEPPLVSVIVPTHNRPEMLREAIRSILDQTFRDFEVIVVNDAGEDVSSVVKEFSLSNIIYRSHHTNKGLAAARNTGIRAARGKYIAYLDDDDIYLPDHLEILSKTLETTDYRVAYTDARRVIQQRNETGYETVGTDQPYSSDFDYDRILSENFIPVLCVMHEKSCCDAVGGFDESLKRHEDWDLWIRMSREFRFRHISQVTCEYTSRLEGSMIAGSVPSFLRTFDAICTKYEALIKNRSDLAMVQKRQRFNMLHETYSFLSRKLSQRNEIEELADPGARLISELCGYGATEPEALSAFYLQKALARAESPGEVIPCLLKALQFDADNVTARQRLSGVLFDQGDYAEAVKHLEYLLSLNPLELSILKSLALYYWGANNEKAARLSQRLLELSPGETRIRELLEQHSNDPAEDKAFTVAIFSHDAPEYACARIRLLGPLSRLARSVKIVWGSTFQGNELVSDLVVLDDVDLIVVQRFYPRTGTLHCLERIFGSGKPVVYELDDLILDIPDSHHLKNWISETAGILPALLPRVHAVTVSTSLIADAVARYHKTIHILPNLIDEGVWNSKPIEKKSGPVVIGFAGTATHREDLAMVEPALLRIAEKYGSRVVFRFFGDASPLCQELPGFSFIPFAADYDSYARTLPRAGFDIAIVPLADNSFNRAKSNIKWLEYSACGIPGIYSDLPPYNDCVRDGETGVLAGDDHEIWFQQLSRLIDNPDLRHSIALKARHEVLANFTTRSWAHRWLDLYRDIVAAHKTGTATRPSVSIVIPAFNRAQLTRQCLDALFATTGGQTVEIILVDNASDDWTPEYLATLGERIRVIRNDTNRGFAHACNQGAEVAVSDQLLFLNNDTIPQTGWLEALIKGAREEQADIAGARLLYPNGAIQHAGVAFGRDMGPYHIFSGFAADDPAVVRRRHLQAVTAACMLVKRDLFLQLGGFDEGYRNGFEDLDFCLKASERGARITYIPECVVIHLESASEGRKQHDAANIARFNLRWQGRIYIDDEDLYRSEGISIVREPDGRIFIERRDRL